MTYAMLKDCRTQGAGGGGARAPSVNPNSARGQIMLTTLLRAPPPGFSDPPTALSAAGVQNGNWSNSISPGQLNMSK